MTATLIVGTGLIGTSIGLALTAAGETVYLEDALEANAAAAAAMGAGSAGPAPQDVTLVVVATPPLTLADEVAAALERFPDATVTDAGSVKQPVLEGLRALGADIARYTGSHPMAGSHRSGPLGAREDLFVGRTWVVTPHDQEDYARTNEVTDLARRCGANPVILTPADHDVAVAQVSHLPQLVSSLVAGRLNAVPYRHLSLAGQGIRDVTRIAASDPELWGQIIALNRAAVRTELEALQQDLADLLAGLDNTAAVKRVIEKGRDGVTGLPGKHGRGLATIWEPVTLEIPDRPGALAEAFADASKTGVNVEDIAIEHDPVREAGYLTLSVDGAERAARLGAAMVELGWKLRS